MWLFLIPNSSDDSIRDILRGQAKDERKTLTISSILLKKKKRNDMTVMTADDKFD